MTTPTVNKNENTKVTKPSNKISNRTTGEKDDLSRCPSLLPESDGSLLLGSEEPYHPRRLLHLTSTSPVILAYGGNDGTVSALSLKGSTTTSQKTSVSVVHRLDEAVRAIACSSDGKRVAVGTEDGTVTVYETASEDDGDNESIHPFLGSAHLSSSAAKGGDDDDDDMYESLLTQDDTDHEASASTDILSKLSSWICQRFSLPVRDLQFLPRNGKDSPYYLACAHEAREGLCVVDVTSSSSSSKKWLEDEATRAHGGSGVKALSVHGSWMASLDMTGRLCMWDVGEGEPKLWDLLHRDGSILCGPRDLGESMGADALARCGRPVFSPSGHLLALPGSTEPQLRSQRTPQKFTEPRYVVVDGAMEGHSDVIVTMAWSSDTILVTGGRDRRVFVWSIAEDDGNVTGQILGELCHKNSTKNENFPTGPTFLLFHDRHLHITTADGRLYSFQRDRLWTKSSRSSTRAKSFSMSITTENETTDEIDEELGTQPSSQTRKDYNDDDNDQDDDLMLISQEPVTSLSKFVSEEADEDGVLVESQPLSQATREKSVTFEDENFDHDEEDSVANLDTNDDDDPDNHDRVASLPTLVETHAPFAPSATPLGGHRRILCWNHLGCVTHRMGGHMDENGFSETDQPNIVDISFVNSASRRPATFTERMGFILGSLGDDGCIFATDVQDDEDDGNGDRPDNEDDDILRGVSFSESTKRRIRNGTGKNRKGGGSRLFFHRHETFGSTSDKDWHLELPAGERVLGAACGRGWVAVVTSLGPHRSWLRLFRTSGIQTSVQWLDGSPVTIVGRDRYVFVVSASGGGSLEYSYLDGVNGHRITGGRIPIAGPGTASFLTWAGLGRDLCPYVMDSHGVLSMLALRLCDSHEGPIMDTTASTAITIPTPLTTWFPILNTEEAKKSTDDHFWPVSVMDGKLICVPLKGGNEYPDTVRRPLTTTLPLRYPCLTSVIGGGSATGAAQSSSSTDTLEETCARGRMALQVAKFHQTMRLRHEPSLADELDREYNKYTIAVDKVVLKLFFQAVDLGKVEYALDLTEQLHNEKSFNVAMKAAEQCNRIKLSDEILAVKERMFPVMSDDDNYDSDRYSSRSEDDFDNDDGQSQSIHSKNVTPDSKGVGFNRTKLSGSYAKRLSQDDNNDETTRPRKRRPSTTSTVDGDVERSSNVAPRRIQKKPNKNPFATKKQMGGSPGLARIRERAPSDDNTAIRPTLSRMSSVSEHARTVSKRNRQIL